MATHQLVSTSFNLFRESSPREAEHDLYKVLQGGGGRGPVPDIVGLNEAANHLVVIHAAARALGYQVIIEGDSRAARNNVVLVRQSTCRVRSTPEPRLVSESTPGSPARHQVRARVFHIPSKQVVMVRVDHANSHVENKAWWRLPRQRQYREHIALLGRQAGRAAWPTIWLGDLNVSFRSRVARAVPFFPVKVMRANGARCSYDVLGAPVRGTHHKRLIDYTFLKGCTVLEFDRHHIDGGRYYSDHRPLTVVFKVRSAE